MGRITSLLIAALLVAATARAQDHVPGQVIVWLEAWATPADVQRAFAQRFDGQRLDHLQALVPGLRIHLMAFDTTAVGTTAALRWLQTHKAVHAAQFNHYVAPRSTLPDDPGFAQQWALLNTGQNGGLPGADIRATLAWDRATGGPTLLGDTVVVAIIDEGFDLAHPDLPFWRNTADIPGNGIDDDANGYTDDHTGWNAYAFSGNIPSNAHGTHVAGIAAARGDNALGISGVAWDTRIMPIAGASGNEAVVVIAYGYAWAQRRRYNLSGGQEGAFVVATNASFGVNFGNPADYPIWCSLYDSLGAQGILSVAATMNNPGNVDTQGDMPTACPSPWLITVTNTTNTDTKNGGAASGALSIDLGAPGTGIYSTIPGGNYGTSTGTSQAAPHVTGAVGLLASAACPALLVRYRNDPAATALLLKSVLLAGVDTLASLQGLTLTGGRLNLDKSLRLLEDSCALLPGDCLPPYLLTTSNRTDSSVRLHWLQPGAADSFVVRYRLPDDTVWTSGPVSDTTQVLLGGLQACTNYVFQVEARCDSGGSGFLATAGFRSEGCCEPPAGLGLRSTGDTTVLLGWQPVYGADTFWVRLRALGDSLWQSAAVDSTAILWTGLLPCRGYEVQVATVCDSVSPGFGPSYIFTTQGCGACLDQDYCDIAGLDATFEWIDAVRIGDLDMISGNDGGYGDHATPAYQFRLDSVYALELTPGYGGFAFQEAWRIWVDLDQDGAFGDTTELLFDSGPVAGTVQSQLSFPAGTLAGATRLRVAMRFPGFSGTERPQPCGDFDAGEAEDYCITLTTSDVAFCPAPTDRQAGYLLGTDTLRLRWRGDADQYELRLRRLGFGPWQTAVSDTLFFDLVGLDSCVEYVWEVRARCGAFASGYVAGPTFTSRGCGACSDLNYCAASGSADVAWVEAVAFAGIANRSGYNGGYAAFTQIRPPLRRGDTTVQVLTPGFATAPTGVWWQVWADWDQDGAWSAAERVYQSSSADSAEVEITFAVPGDALAGPARLRVAMRRDSLGDACGDIGTGEVEDYCLQVDAALGVVPRLSPTLALFPNPTDGLLSLRSDRPLTRVEVLDPTGRVLLQAVCTGQQDLTLDLRPLPPGMYLLCAYAQEGVVIRRVVRR
ncbi:MAG: hypothetical protein OHK0039_10220 [Bacteroidia bacterium]